MSEYSSYFLYRKYQVLNGELIDLGITSVDGDGTMPLVTRNECDPACGCQTEPIYRWVSVAGGYECSGTTKMAQEKEQVSNDNGETWSDVIPLTTRPALPVIKYNSEDCGYVPPTPECKCSAYTYSFTSATVSSAATSITLSYTGCSKLDLASAATYNWIAIGGQNYNSGTSVGNIIANISANTSTSRNAAFYLFLDGTGCNTIYISQQSGATPAFEGKYKLTLSDSSIVSAECDSTSAISYSEIGDYKDITVSAVIGNCVTSIGYAAFDDFESLTSVTIPNSVTGISSTVFSSCSGLTNVTIPNSVTSVGGYVFQFCYSLTDVTMPSGITSIPKFTFYTCTSLPTIDIPSGVTSIGNSAFENCYSLTGITIPSGVTSIGSSAFNRCSGLTSITIPSGVTSIGEGAFRNCSGLTSIDIPNSVRSIGDYTFEYCSGLTSCTIGNGVTSISKRLFNRCSGLTSVNIPSGVTSIGNQAFYICSGLTSIDIPSGVTYIGDYTFYGCLSLTSVTIPSGVTSIGLYAFYNCESLVSVICNATNPPALGSNAFDYTNNCPIYVPSSSVNTYKSASVWSSYSSRIVGIEPCPPVFEGKYKLTLNDSSTVSAECSSSSAISDSEILAYTGSVTSAVIGDCVTEIGVVAFYNCSGLTNVTIPNSVTSIDDNAFDSCTSLASIDIPDSVTYIGEYAFISCTSLTSVTINATTPPTLGSDAFTDTPIANGTGTIYVPSGSVNTYKSASGWSDYASRIQAIP